MRHKEVDKVRYNQAEWDALHMATVSTRVRWEVATELAKRCAARGITVYAWLQEVIRDAVGVDNFDNLHVTRRATDHAATRSRQYADRTQRQPAERGRRAAARARRLRR